MATGKLVGTDSAGTGTHGANYVCYTKFTAAGTGIITELKVYALATGHVKVAIYSDNSGEPGDKITGNDSSQAIIADQWNTLTIANTNIVKDTPCWLGVIGDTDGATSWRALSGVIRRYKAATYSSFTWPSSAGSGFVIANDYEQVLAGYGILTLSPGGINQPISFDSSKLLFIVKPLSLGEQLAYGMPAIITSALVIYPSGSVEVIAGGTPTLCYLQTISPLGIDQFLSVGILSVSIFGILKPYRIAEIVAYGGFTILKYVWHVVLDGQYNIESPEINRSYIIGRDQFGNPVYGLAEDSIEMNLVGERLDVQQELAIPTSNEAASMASAVLSKMRLSKAKGFILIPPNCGQELFDVVQISDSVANQLAVKFRVAGIRFEYNVSQSRYEQELILAAV